MPRKIKSHKRRAALTDDNIKWLEGSGPSFTQFKQHEELVALWLAHGDPDVATWDMDEDSRPRPVAD
jgi:hypothetical protein